MSAAADPLLGFGWRSGQAELLEASEVVFQRPGMDDLAVAEQPHVSPLSNVRPDLGTCLEDEGLQAPVEQVGGSGQADRAGPMTTTGRPERAPGAWAGCSIVKGWMPLVGVIGHSSST